MLVFYALLSIDNSHIMLLKAKYLHQLTVTVSLQFVPLHSYTAVSAKETENITHQFHSFLKYFHF